MIAPAPTEVFRVVVTRYPKRPVDTADFYDHFPDSTNFFWPSAERLYRSRSGAVVRARLLRSYGAKVRVERGTSIAWAEVPS